jgi:hypothetical protein
MAMGPHHRSTQSYWKEDTTKFLKSIMKLKAERMEEIIRLAKEASNKAARAEESSMADEDDKDEDYLVCDGSESAKSGHEEEGDEEFRIGSVMVRVHSVHFFNI